MLPKHSPASTAVPGSCDTIDSARVRLVQTSDSVKPWNIASAVVQGQRDQLVAFWLACPDDALDGLWNSPPGQATREMVAQLTPTTFLTDAQVALRNRLGSFLQQGFHQPGAVKAVIANFLLSPPGQFRILNPESHLPAWLVPAYRSLYEQGQSPLRPAASPAVPMAQPALPVQQVPQPDFGAMPGSLAELVQNRLQLNRLLGLSNLYYIDPEDVEIREELMLMRRSLAELILAADESGLESLFSGDFGDRYWALVRSGIQKEALVPDDEQLKQRVTSALSPAQGGGFGRPGAVTAFLVAITYYLPGSMQVEQAEQKLPGWLLPGYRQVFAEALPA